VTENDAAPASASAENIVEFSEAKRGRASTTIHRATKRRQFTIIANETLTDKALSIEARGMLAFLLTMPDDWTIRIEHIAAELRIGRDKTQKIMRELQTAGYAQLQDARDAASGRLGGKRWIIFELANIRGLKPESARADLFAESLKTRRTENQVVGSITDNLKNRQSEKPTVGKSGPIPITKKQPNNDFNLPQKPHAQAPTWAEFRSKWPWGSTDSPEAAQRVWKRLSSEDQALALKSIPIFIGKVDDQGNKRPHAKTYLRDRRWVAAQETDEPIAVAPCSRETPQSGTLVARNIWVSADTPEGRAWARFWRETKGKSPPVDAKGGWRFASRWPPAAGGDGPPEAAGDCRPG
jgi:hypothetical protein